MKKVILYIIYDREKKAYLSELNPANHTLYPNQTTFPGGKVEPNETLEETIIREMNEELGITPSEYEQLGKPLLSDNGKIQLHPFLIKKWKGEIPDKILDKENVLIVWEKENEILESQIYTRPIIVKRAKKLLNIK